MELIQTGFVELLTSTVVSQTVYLNILFPSKYRYYFELVQDDTTPIRIEHPFRLYFPQTIVVEEAPENGIYLTLESTPEFTPFGPLTAQIYIPQNMYNAIIQALSNPINSMDDLVPPPEESACGEVEFVLISTDSGDQIKIDFVNTSYKPEVPVTVKTLKWQEVLYDVMNLPLSPPPPPPLVLLSPISIPSFEFVYTASGDLGVTLIDPRYCFFREWITLPAAWTDAIKDFAGV